MDPAVKYALCWAKYTMDELIAEEGFSCTKLPNISLKRNDVIGRPPPKKQTLDIDPEKLHYIASQHVGECYWDTFQNILMFADGYRDVNVKFIMDDYSENPRDLYPVPYETDTFKAKIGKFYGTTDKNLINFLAGTFLRYINIKLLEKKEAVPTLQRAPSLNLKKGIKLKEIGNKICPTFWNRWEVQDPIKLYNMIKNMKPFKDIIILHNKEYKGVEYREGENKFKLIGVHINVLPNDGTVGHALGIIRFKDKFYLLDNHLGYAVDINKYIIAFTGYNFVMKFVLTSTIYSFDTEEILIAKGQPFTRVKTFSQADKGDQIFLYMRT